MGQHAVRVHLRQRRVARGRGATAPAPTSGRCTSAGRAPRSHSRRTSPGSTRWADRRRCRTTRGGGRWCPTRRSGSTRSTRTAVATRCRSWCRGPTGRCPPGELRNQFVHVTDLLPTVLGITGVQRPDRWRGEPVLPLAGEDLGATLLFDAAPGRAGDVIIENEGHRAYRRESWEAVTRHAPRTSFSRGGLGAVRHGGGSRTGARPLRRAPGAARGAASGLGRRGMGRTRSSPSTRARATGSCCARRGPSATTDRWSCGPARRARPLALATPDPVARRDGHRTR